MDKHAHTNALINETSPYLLQHAHNPVDWYPWGEAALEKAGRENKLLIVSIGYSSCHWCHVMERESFEDPAVAQLMNKHFVCIKVDREERPDIDHIYMTAVQMLNQQGGWPLNCIALPDGLPVWGGTYFPIEQWMEALSQVEQYYRQNPEATRKYAADLAEGIRQNSIFRAESREQAMSHEQIHGMVKKWSEHFDPEYGGQKGAPKFPMPVNLDFLMHYGYQYGNQDVLSHVELTLTSMARGGIYDQVGGGFARYSVDPLWKVPHFEKMLYDNAQLIRLYSRAYQLFGRDSYARVIRQSIEFVQREMLSGEGAFYSALDADSEGEEGKYYVWDRAELEERLEGDFELFGEYYNVNATGFWELNKYILYRTSDPEVFAADRGFDPGWFRKKISEWDQVLLSARSRRIPPGLDDKSLSSWGSLMISGLVQAHLALKESPYLDLAVAGARLIREKLWSDDGILYRNYKDGRRSIPGFHTDYAHFTEACLDLYAASLDREWLDLAVELTESAMERFFDPGTDMFNYSGKDSASLITNHVEIQDNVIPSSNSVMAHNLFRLGHLMTNRAYLDLAASMMKQMQDLFLQYPRGFSNWGRLILMHLNPFFEIAVVGPSARSTLGSLTAEYLPHALVAGSEQPADLPLFRDRFEGGLTRIFVCRDNVCQLPVESPEDARRLYSIRD